MQLNKDQNRGVIEVKSYKQGELVISQLPLNAPENGNTGEVTASPKLKTLTHSVILTNRGIIDWTPRTIDSLSTTDWSEVIKAKPNVVIIGTGETLSFPPQALLAPLFDQQIGVEVMDTHAACRTYNILMAEDRNALAALII